jgi:hypothetical protein
MIELQNIEIEIEGLKILPIHNYYDLTTGHDIYDISPSSGGLSFKAKAIVKDIEQGFVYVTQICTDHTLKISTNNNEYLFDSLGETLRDTPSETGCHFNSFQISNDSIKNFGITPNEIAFFDAPFKELFKWWTAIEYNVKFETWIQYSESFEFNKNLKPLLKFNWNLDAIAKQENENWIIKESNYPSKEDIISSIQHFKPTDSPLLPCDLRHLGKTVKEFSLQYEELKKKL